MALTKIPAESTLVDQQFLQITGPDNIQTGYQYDKQQRALYFKESQVIFPSFHGATHIAEDPVPDATCDTPGLLSADDKCKLDALVQTRLGVLGFQGAGFCVLPGCKVLLEDGNQQNIEDIQVGDVVITQSGLPKPITKVHCREIDEDVFEIDCNRHIAGGLQLTAEHSVLATTAADIANAPPKWVKAKELIVGDFIVARDISPDAELAFTFDRIDHIRTFRHTGSVHDLTVADDHSYVVNGLVIHNSDDGGWLCFPGNAAVLRQDGRTSPIADLAVGDSVVTHTGAVQPVLRTFRRAFRGDLVNIWMYGHRRDRLTMTAEHPVLAVRNVQEYSPIGLAYAQRDGNAELPAPTWLPASQLQPGDYVARRLSSNVIVDRLTMRISDVAARIEVDDGIAYSVESWNESLGSNKSERAVLMFRNTAVSIPNTIEISPEFLRLCGYYLAEGHIDGPAGRPKEVIFSLHIDEAFGDLGADITHCCQTVFGLPTITKPQPYSDCGCVCVHSAIMARFIKAILPGNAHTKAIPQWLMELPPDKQRHFLIAFLEGDGYLKNGKRNKAIECALCNAGLIDQLCAILERQGCVPSLSSGRTFLRTTGKWYDKYKLSVQAADAEWLWEALGGKPLPPDNIYSPRRLDFSLRSDGYTLQRIAAVTTTPYDGDVYNIEVDDDNSYVVNGAVVHNCGDIILAAGTDFISLERFGNVIRFTVDVPSPFLCACEECTQIFWIQDETDVAAIRPPTCSGRLPGTNSYGELKVYLFPESTIVDPSNATITLQQKRKYPAFIFKRYDDSIAPGTAEHEMILKRDPVNEAVTEVGWAMTPGITGLPECVWFTGKDNDGNQIRFDLNPEAEPGLLGALLYKGHLITKLAGVIVDYGSTVLSTNHYICRKWDVNGNQAIGTTFAAKNVWQYINAEMPTSGSTPQSLILDVTIDILPVGTLVDLWYFKVGEVAGEPINRYYFSQRPRLNPQHLWVWSDGIQFGDTLVARDELLEGAGSGDDATVIIETTAIRDLETSQWGIANMDDPLLSYDVALDGGTVAADISAQHRAVIDESIPGLKVVLEGDPPVNFSERPVHLWCRKSLNNALVRIDVGRPTDAGFSPIDVIIRGHIDEYSGRYMRVIGTGLVNGLHFIQVKGVHFHDLPPFGAVRVIHPASNHNEIFYYRKKFIYTASGDSDALVLTGDTANNVAYTGSTDDILELLHQEYNSPVVRLEFAIDPDTDALELQFKVGMLEMDQPYEENALADEVDDYVRGLAAGYTVSAIYTQDGGFAGTGIQPATSPDDFLVYDGGATGTGGEEFWNRLEIMMRDDQVWVWWNQLLIPPNPSLNLGLPTPVSIATPYFPMPSQTTKQFGKVGLRLWPGAVIRRMDIRSQVHNFNEYQYGGLSVG